MTPNTSIELELLALLSPTPAPIWLLAQDLGLHRRDIFPLLKRLQNLGYLVRPTRQDGEQAAFVDPAGWPAAERAALAYVDAD